ncbi:MAG: DUF1707 domain-containing protein [Marmoricola sp.]
MTMTHQGLHDLRLSDRDRARARKRLVREHGRGRIDPAELDERLDAVATARTHGDLASVFADLVPFAAVDAKPFSPYATRRGRRYGRGFRPFPFPLLPLLVLAIVIAATGHVPWIAIGIVAAVLVLTAPWRWSRRARWAC